MTYTCNRWPEASLKISRLPASDRSIANFIWAVDQSILALVVDGFHTKFFSISKTGKAEARAGFAVNPASFDAAADRVAFVGETSIEAPEVWLSGSSGTGRSSDETK